MFKFVYLGVLTVPVNTRLFLLLCIQLVYGYLWYKPWCYSFVLTAILVTMVLITMVLVTMLLVTMGDNHATNNEYL